MRMRKKHIVLPLLLLCAALCAACGGQKELPAPAALYAEILEGVSLPRMSEMPEDYLPDSLGIPPEKYEAAVCALPLDGLAPDELVIVRAKDGSAASEVERLLQAHLQAREADAERYLPENLTAIRSGAILRKDTTVCLAVSAQAEQIRAVLEGYGFA